MSGAIRKIDILANIIIIAVALLLGAILVKRHLLADPTGNPNRARMQQEITVGAKLSLPDVDWATNGKTVLLVLQSGCRFCSESALFYRRLAQELFGQRSPRLIAILPQSVNESKKYLNDLGVSIDEIRQASLKLLGVSGTPMLILVNNAGAVTDLWFGKLTASQEAEVFSRLQADNLVGGTDNTIPRPNTETTNISADDLKQAIDNRQRVIVLDVRERAEYAEGHIPGARNIPVDELSARAIRELPRSNLVVAYCTCTEDGLSKVARQILIERGFPRVLILRGGLASWQQAGLPTVMDTR